MARIIRFYIPLRHRRQSNQVRTGKAAKVLMFRPTRSKNYLGDDWRILGLDLNAAGFRSPKR